MEFKGTWYGRQYAFESHIRTRRRFSRSVPEGRLDGNPLEIEVAELPIERQYAKAKTYSLVSERVVAPDMSSCVTGFVSSDRLWQSYTIPPTRASPSVWPSLEAKCGPGIRTGLCLDVLGGDRVVPLICITLENIQESRPTRRGTLLL